MPTRAHTPGVPAKAQIRKVIMTKSKVSVILLVSHSLFTATAINSGAKRGKTNQEPGVRHPAGRGEVWTISSNTERAQPSLLLRWVCLPPPTSLSFLSLPPPQPPLGRSRRRGLTPWYAI